MIIDKIVLQKDEPRITSVLWLKPVGQNLLMYAWDGGWKPIKAADDNGTYTTDDDTVMDVTDIRESLKEKSSSFLDSSDQTEYSTQI